MLRHFNFGFKIADFDIQLRNAFPFLLQFTLNSLNLLSTTVLCFFSHFFRSRFGVLHALICIGIRKRRVFVGIFDYIYF